MKKNEFDTRMELINTLRTEASKYRDDFKARVQKLTEDISVVDTIEQRDELFAKYLEYINKFSYSDSLVSPSDLFPGIRVASDMADPAQLAQEADEMKMQSLQIDNLTQIIDSQSESSMEVLKRLMEDLREYMIRANQIYKEELDLLKDMDSIYDIGQFARNT